MGQIGVLFALTESEVVQLIGIPDDRDRREWFDEHIETKFFESQPDDLYELDKTWDGIQRILTDGTLAATDNDNPLNFVILGGEAVYTTDRSYTMSLKSPPQVHEVALALKAITYDDFINRHKQHIKSFWFRLFHDSGQDRMDRDYIDTCWGYLEELIPFWQRADETGKYILFTVDH